MIAAWWLKELSQSLSLWLVLLDTNFQSAHGHLCNGSWCPDPDVMIKADDSSECEVWQKYHQSYEIVVRLLRGSEEGRGPARMISHHLTSSQVFTDVRSRSVSGEGWRYQLLVRKMKSSSSFSLMIGAAALSFKASYRHIQLFPLSHVW